MKIKVETKAEVEDIKLYLRIDGAEEDSFIEALMKAAEEYMEECGVKKSTSELYKLCIKMLCNHWYENREVTGVDTKLAHSLDSIIFKLKYKAGGVSV